MKGAWVLMAGTVGVLITAMSAAVAWAAPGPSESFRADEVPATANHLNRPVAANSPQLAVHPANSKVQAMATRLDGPDFGCGLQLSGDGGRGWVPAVPVPKLPAGAEKCYAPEVAFDGQGTLYYLFVGLAGKTNVPMGVFLAASSDSGRRFSTPRRVLGRYSFGVRLAIDARRGERGRMHLVWLAANARPALGSMPPPPNPILSRYSDDGGRTWTRPVQASDRGRTRVVAPALAVGPGRTVHVMYYDLGDDARDYHGLEGPTWEEPWALILATSRDGGRTFGKGVVVDAAVVPPERVMLVFTMPPPSLAVGAGGRLYAAWHDGRNRDWDVFARRSVDAGRTWASAVRLNDDAVGNGRHQYLPRLSVAPGGRVDAVFYDRRQDAENVRNDVAYTYSLDGGRTFASNRILTAKPSDSRIGQRYVGPAATGLVEFGSRLGLLSQDDRAVAAWTDTRNSRYPVQQDIFTTVVHVAGPEESSGRGERGDGPLFGVLGLALATLAVASAAVRFRRARRPVTVASPR